MLIAAPKLKGGPVYKELLQFLFQNKKWWLLPPVIVLIIFGLLITFTTASPVSAFIYMLL